MKATVQLAAAIVALIASSRADAQDFCDSLKQATKESGNGFENSLGHQRDIVGQFGFSDDGYTTSLKMPGFDLCAIDKDRKTLSCRGKDNLGDAQPLEEDYDKLSDDITRCLHARLNVDHGWRVSSGFHSRSTDRTLKVWTDASHQDGNGKLQHVALEISSISDENLFYIKLVIHWY